MDSGRWLRISIALSALFVVAIAVLLILATIPLVHAERPGVAWSGFTLGYTPPPYDTVFDALVGQFCPPQGDNSALVVGNVTVSLTWASANGEPVGNFNVFASGYPAGTSSLGSYVYFVNNSASGGFSSESATISRSLCNFPLTIGADPVSGDSVKVTIETVYTYNTTVPVL